MTLTVLSDATTKTCKEVLDSHAPVTVRICTKRYKPFWFNNCVDEARRARLRHERKYRKTHSELDRVAYIQSQRNVVNVITDAKCHYYNEKLSGSNSKEMFKTLNELLNKNSSTLPYCISSDDLTNEFCEFFTAKNDKIRNKVDNICSTSDANVIHDCRQKVDCCMSTLKSVNVEDLTKIIMKSPSKSCLLDPLPTWLLKKHLHFIMPVLCHIVNVSLETGQFPSELRKAIISPVLKKPSLDRQQLGSYRPVSNLSYLGKLIERVVSSRVTEFIDSNNLGEPLQSAYGRMHSTETALLAVQDTFLRAIDRKEAVFLVMIDMSAVFDTVDIPILLQRLRDDFGLCGVVGRWFESYLCGRSCQVSVQGSVSSETHLKYGVPQGSVIGPQVFTLYSHVIGQIIRQHSVLYHIYTDDVQLFLTFNPTIPVDAACALFKLTRCIKDLQIWMTNNKLMMNPDKTEFFIASCHNHYERLQHLSICLDVEIFPSPTVRNLGTVLITQ